MNTLAIAIGLFTVTLICLLFVVYTIHITIGQIYSLMYSIDTTLKMIQSDIENL